MVISGMSNTYTEHKGFILTQKEDSYQGLYRLIYSGISETGPFRIIITNQPPLFFIKRETSLPAGFVKHKRKEIGLKTFDGSPVDALYFASRQDFNTGRKILDRKGIRAYESDIDPKERFLMERFINGPIEFMGESRYLNGYTEFINPRIQRGTFLPRLSIISLDIETGTGGELYSAASYMPLEGRSPEKNVFMIGDPRESTTGLTFCGTEKELLTRFLQYFRKLDPDIIIGWNISGFDLKFLGEKFHRHKLVFAAGRDGSPVRIIEIQGSRYIADIDGRIVIDGPQSLRSAFYKFENYKLNTVAMELLGEGKDIGPSENGIEEIERRFREDKKALAFYNIKDCELTYRIFEKTALIDHVLARAVISGLRMDKINMSVAAFDHFMLPEIHRKGYAAPNIADITSSGHAAGGWVFEPVPGLYDNIIVLDFKSLYPSIINTFKIDPLARLRADINPVLTPAGIGFSGTEHILPDYIRKLMKKRESAKTQGDNNLSQAIKILMNSFYGVMGTTGCRFYHHDLPSAITGTGQWLLKETSAYLEENGYTVLYGDTDSVFVKLKKEEEKNPDAAGKTIALKINRYFDKIIKDNYNVKSELEIEYEKHYIKLFLPAVRGGTSGAKKRYAGLLIINGTEELVFTGMEAVRSDWTKLAKEFQHELFRRVFKQEELKDWIKKLMSLLVMQSRF